MAGPHEAFKALAPIDWSTIDHEGLQTFTQNTLNHAQCLVDSIPVSLTTKADRSQGRPRAATDTNTVNLPGRAPQLSGDAEQLRNEWKEVQVNPRDNPLGVSIYRLASKDKKGAWFARRSVHEGLPFDKWKLGLQREFAETMKVQGKPGEGKIRGIGADKRVENTTVDGCGKVEVYQLSAQFPGPTTPRDFVTLLLSSDCGLETPMQEKVQRPRYFMVVSKPCNHPECPQRNGYIRGQYESVEFIREMRVEKPLRRVRSSIDLSDDLSAAARRKAINDLGKEATLRSARSAMSSSTPNVGDEGGRKRGRTISFAGTAEEKEEEDDDQSEMVVEWLMVTRSDPGGSVPRFMVEKGTPAGIAGDANKFVQWISSANLEDGAEASGAASLTGDSGERPGEDAYRSKGIPTSNLLDDPSGKPIPETEDDPAPSGFYGIIAGALGVAQNMVASHIPNPWGSAKGGDTDSESDSDETSSVQSFHSVEEDSSQANTQAGDITPSASASPPTIEVRSTQSSESAAAKSTATSQHEKDLRKLEERRRKIEEKTRKAQERALSKKDQDSQRDEVAIAKLKEKHDREVAKQEEKYRKELKRLEDKREAEQKKAEQRKRKQMEREEKQNISLELERVKAERDVAWKQIEILKQQVGDLQHQNTMLVREIGKKSRESLGSLGSLDKEGGVGGRGEGLKRTVSEMPT